MNGRAHDNSCHNVLLLTFGQVAYRSWRPLNATGFSLPLAEGSLPLPQGSDIYIYIYMYMDLCGFEWIYIYIIQYPVLVATPPGEGWGLGKLEILVFPKEPQLLSCSGSVASRWGSKISLEWLYDKFGQDDLQGLSGECPSGHPCWSRDGNYARMQWLHVP